VPTGSSFTGWKGGSVDSASEMPASRKVLYSAKIPKDFSSGCMHVWLTEKIEVVVFRKGNCIRIFNSICPHMGAQLQCNQRKDEVFCPWHGLRFSLRDQKGEQESNHPRYKRIREYEGEIVNCELKIYE
jgi:nitrite reductase/ring-hydroxylating ferredoxin subunit